MLLDVSVNVYYGMKKLWAGPKICTLQKNTVSSFTVLDSRLS